MIERYRSKGLSCCGGTRIGVRRYSLISSKTFWHLSFHVCDSFFFRSLKMGSQVKVSLAMNRLMNWMGQLLDGKYMLCSGKINESTSFAIDNIYYVSFRI